MLMKYLQRIKTKWTKKRKNVPFVLPGLHHHAFPYRHLEQEVVLAKAEAQVGAAGGGGPGAVEQAGGPQHQDQVEVPWEGGLEEGRYGDGKRR